MFGLCGPMVALLEKNRKVSAVLGFLVTCLLVFCVCFKTDKLDKGRSLPVFIQGFIKFVSFIAGIAI